MAENEVYMDIPAVKGISKTFGTVADVLDKVSQALEVMIDTLKATAFVGLVGGLAYAQYLDVIKTKIDEVSEKCQELSKDVSDSVDAFERGDQQGATKFY
jgi:hypothetical protein